MYVFMDIEATGQVQSEAFQVAMVITDSQFELKEMLNFYVEHDGEIEPHVLDLCHLNDTDLEKISSISYTRQAAIEVIERVFNKNRSQREEVIFVGKMIKGDIKWLRKIGVYCNQIEFMEDSKYIELNRFFEENRKLSEDCLIYGLTKELLIEEVEQLLVDDRLTYGTPELLGGGYHNALVDAYATYRVFKEILFKEKVELKDCVEQCDWKNRSYLMMNRKAMEDKISVRIYQNQMLKEIEEEYGIRVSSDKLTIVDSIMFDNGCLMGVTKKEILLYFYLRELRKRQKPYFNRYSVRIKRNRQIKRLSIVALNRFDLFVQLSKIMSPQHMPKSFEKQEVLEEILQNPGAYLEASGYTVLGVKLKESNIEFKKIG